MARTMNDTSTFVKHLVHLDSVNDLLGNPL
jgi:hypothetical protein